MFTEDEMKAQTNEAKRAEAAIYFFVETVHTLESNGWKRDPRESSNPWNWWRNPEVAEGSCSLGAALHYEHARQDRIRPMVLVGDEGKESSNGK